MATNTLFGLCTWVLGILSASVIGHHSVSLSHISIGRAMNHSRHTLFDFTDDAKVEDWIEQSDTVRTVGMSKAALVMQNTQVFKRAVFFTLLNPQQNGAGFAGMRTLTNLDLSWGHRILLKARGQGNTHYKIVLRHKGENNEPYPSYENFFESPTDFSIISLNLEDFKPYYRGRPLNSTEAEPLDTSAITSFGIQIYGGVYSPFKQHGPSSLEIDWITLEQ